MKRLCSISILSVLGGGWRRVAITSARPARRNSGARRRPRRDAGAPHRVRGLGRLRDHRRVLDGRRGRWDGHGQRPGRGRRRRSLRPRQLGDEVLIINRDRGENITILGGSPLALIDQYGTGGGSNPQDVAVAGGKLYVPALGTAGVVVIDRATRALRTIAIAGDPDGRPDCVSAFAVDGKVFVACGLLDNFAATRPGKVAVIDVATDTVTTSFDLPARNPIGLFARGGAALGGDLLLGTAPSFTDYTSGCVVRVTTGATPAANGCLVSNQDLGGLANHIAVDPDDGTPWVAVTGYAGPGFDNPYGQAARPRPRVGRARGGALDRRPADRRRRRVWRRLPDHRRRRRRRRADLEGRRRADHCRPRHRPADRVRQQHGVCR
jgi:hypothetical protein